jgi:hypothetical protein
VGLCMYPLIVDRQRLGKHVPPATKGYWWRRILCGPCRIKEKYKISSSHNFSLVLRKKQEEENL